MGGFEHFLSQFADDTTLFVKNFQNLPLMWSCVRKYERATGMKVNVKKTEGIRAGALRGEEYDWHANGDVRLTTRLEGGKVVADLSVGLGANIAWCKKGDYIISLGTPIGDDFSLDRFWESKMNKTKRVMAGWHDINNVTPYGRALLANTSVFGRYRYYNCTLFMDKRNRAAITEDVQKLVWEKDFELDPDEVGSDLNSRRWIADAVQYNPRRAGGLGLLLWDDHVKALAAMTLFRYMDARQEPWKQVLDQYFARYQEGRGAIFTTIPVAEMCKSLSGRARTLPKFFVFALRSLREIKIEPTEPGWYQSTAEARAEPPWTSQRITLTDTSLSDVCRFDMQFNRVQDLWDFETGEPYSDEFVMHYASSVLPTENAAW